ncbi:MAG: SDR family NAD(P)-dependent oxidoreductase [Acidobacteriota bacterium]|nr:SDR family NAD(P)-dependent oxidoreductase [Acidobacteriota bacterium]
MQLKGKQVVVTGAAGFIGSHLAEQLVQEGCRVRALVHYNSQKRLGNLQFLPRDVLGSIEVVAGDVTDPFNTNKVVQGAEIVFHLAALIAIPYSYVAPQSYVNTNVLGTLHVLQACLDHGVKKVVHTSTSETYGTAVYTPIDEGHPLQGQSPYSASKIGADMVAQSYYRSFDLPVATIRPFNTYGPRQSARAVIPTIISQILAGRKQVHLGSLTPVRDLDFVKDTVRGFIKVAEADASVGEVINVGFGKGISIGELAALIATLVGTEVEIVRDPARVRPEKSEVMQLICANGKAKHLVGWEPHYSLQDGLNETIAFTQQNPDLYRPEIYNL